ncbi:MAG: hypothetical protein V2I63_00130 [Pseudomonadales bacterium]|jgi:hypothetical protein|nr:hypothetical protein [Pseudomonadales bacterium]
MTHDVEPLTLTESSLAHYFMTRLADCAERFRPPPHPDTCWYLGNMLERFGRSERLFAWEDGRMTLRPLAQLYGDAIEARNERERCLLLQQLGDMALFIGALYPQRYARRGIRQDYFVGMGGGAYDYLSDNAQRGRHVFGELARTFTRMLEMIATVCARPDEPSDEDVLTLYQRWLETRDPVAERRLRTLGIALSETDTTH